MSWPVHLVPRASCRTRLLVAALLWTLIGAGLLVAGFAWVLGARSAVAIALIPLALTAGWAKGSWVLARVGQANALRITEAGDGRCIGGVFSWASWGLAVGMIATGVLLRRSALPRSWLGLLYAAIGTALAIGSRPAWRQFNRARGYPSSRRSPAGPSATR